MKTTRRMPFALLRALVVAVAEAEAVAGADDEAGAGADDDPMLGLEAQPTTMRPGRHERASTIDELIAALGRG